MNNTTLTVLIGAISVAVATATAWAATRATRSQARSADHAVDAAAYGRATEIYESTITALRGEIARLTDEVRQARAEIHEVRGDLARLQATNDLLAEELTQIRGQEHDDLAGYRTRDDARLTALREREFRESGRPGPDPPQD